MVSALAILATSASIGFLGATLEPHLRQFKLSPVVLGMVFVINGALYALCAPAWGWMVDKWMNPKVAAFVGSVLVVVSFSLIGPASFLPIET
jgi:MFS family permease